MKFPLPCFVCGRELEPATPGHDLNTAPSGGVYFTSPGNYGSTIWDPGPKDGPHYYLEINICDGCVRERQDRVVTVCEVRTNDVLRTPRAGIVDPDVWAEEAMKEGGAVSE